MCHQWLIGCIEVACCLYTYMLVVFISVIIGETWVFKRKVSYFTFSMFPSVANAIVFDLTIIMT
jgi:hypothetical protein